MMRLLPALLLIIAPFSAYAAFNGGLVSGVWLSHNTPLTGEHITLYSAVHNQSDEVFTGSVAFIVNDEQIASVPFSVTPRSIAQVETTHTFKGGDNRIAARIDSDISGIVHSMLPENVVFVDTDTDQDGLGNQKDTDDDGDDFSDETELAENSDPLDEHSVPEEKNVVQTVEAETLKIVDTLLKTGRTVVDTVDPIAQDLAKKSTEKKETVLAEIKEDVGLPEGDEGSQSLLSAVLQKSEGQLAGVGKLSSAWLLSMASFILTHWLWSVAVLILIFSFIFLRRRLV